MRSLYTLTKKILLAVAMVHLAALVATWLVGRPVQAAPAALPDATPTASVGRVDAATVVSTVAEAEPAPTPLPSLAISLQPTPKSLSSPAVSLRPTVVAGANGVNVRSGPGTDFDKIGYLKPGAGAPVVGHHADWWQIEYNGGLAWVAGWVVDAFNSDDVPPVEPPAQPTPVVASPTVIPAPSVPSDIREERWIDVDLTYQTLTAYENGKPVHSTLVSTGLPQTPTPTGQFRIWIKLRYDDMQGVGYYIKDVPFVMYFYQGYGLHGVTWHGNFGHPMSHGCVNLPTAEAEWLFNFADVGTLVNIHQ
jgi:lipoprotein-anchoring transpeptidase ErfK/SrfK